MTEADKAKFRNLLRTAFDALRALEQFCKPEDGFSAQNIAVCNAAEELESNFCEDVFGQCEGCRAHVLFGEQGHISNEDGVILCEKCAPTWDDIKDQWEKDNREELEDGDRDRFFEAYKAHIAGGGSGADKVLYQI